MDIMDSCRRTDRASEKAREGYWRVVSRAREQGARAAIEWLLEDSE